MQTVQLPNTKRRTTRLGYGCSSVMGGMDRRESLRILETAFDEGVRHFDVAPMYGYGAAEGCLGEFLSRHSGQVTVTTKFGIPPAKNPGVLQLARRVAKPILNAIPALKQRAQQAAAAASGPAAPRDLSAASAQASLQNSLRELRVDGIDIFLLHDARPHELRDNEALLEMLQRAQQAGSIGAFGIGTDREDAAVIQHESPAFASVIQCEWSVFNPIGDDAAFGIHHRALASNLRRLQRYLATSPLVARKWSAEINADLSQPGILGELMMRSSLSAYPGSIVLFSSKNAHHIQHNASLTDPSPLDAAAQALYTLVQREASTIPEERAA
jgi:aryl-alcohol dehydrogenase-like predicted oxidoreductase